MSNLNIDGPRACTKAELPEVIALVDSELGRRGTGQTILTDYPLVYEDRNLENIRILKVGGELASVVPFIVWPIDFDGCRYSIGNISPTATAVAHRKKGYGRRCLVDCLRRMELLGCELSVLRTQVPTFLFYQTEDYQAVQSQGWVYPCQREDAGRFVPHGDEVVIPDRLTGAQLAAIQAMHEADGGGSHRSADRYPVQFSLPKMRTLLAYRNNIPAAYLLVSEAINMPGLVEGGGDEAALETLVHRALSDFGPTDTRNAHASLPPCVLSRLLEKRLPGRRQPTAENRMVRMNMPTTFLRRISPWLERANRGVESSYSVTCAGETISFRFTSKGLRMGKDKIDPHFELSRRQLISVLFGAHPSHPPEPGVLLDGLPPFNIPYWPLDRS